MKDTDKTKAQLIQELNGYRQQLEDQNRRLSLQAAVERVRAEAATMRKSADIARVMLAFSVGLEEVGVRHEAVCVNIVDEEAGIMYCYNLWPDAQVPREIIPDEILVQENAVEGIHLLRGDIPLELTRQRGWSVPGYEVPLWVAPDTFPDDYAGCGIWTRRSGISGSAAMASTYPSPTGDYGPAHGRGRRTVKRIWNGCARSPRRWAWAMRAILISRNWNLPTKKSRNRRSGNRHSWPVCLTNCVHR